MNKRTKVFLPPWVGWIMVPVLLLVWGLITYLTFSAPPGEDEMGVVGWLIVTVLLVLVAIMLWLQSSGRLPAFIIEQEDENEK